MSLRTEWAEVNSFEFVEPGEYSDNHGTKNDLHALLFGDGGGVCAIEGTPEQFLALAAEIQREFGQPDEVIVGVRGDTVEIDFGYAVVVNWDDIGDDIWDAQNVLQQIPEGHPSRNHIESLILEIWPELSEEDEDEPRSHRSSTT